MKDAELRERLDKLERMIAAATSSIIGGKTTVEERLSRLQELAEVGRRFEKIQLPSAGVPITVGMSVGAIIFLAGMFFTWLLK